MLFTRHPFLFFTQGTKNDGFLRNLTCTHIMSRCMRQIFVWNFFTLWNIFLGGRSARAKEHQWISCLHALFIWSISTFICCAHQESYAWKSTSTMFLYAHSSNKLHGPAGCYRQQWWCTDCARQGRLFVDADHARRLGFICTNLKSQRGVSAFFFGGGGGGV